MKKDQVEEKLTFLWRKVLDSKMISEDDTNRMSIMAFMYSVGRYNKYQVMTRLNHIITSLELMTIDELVEYWEKK